MFLNIFKNQEIVNYKNIVQNSEDHIMHCLDATVSNDGDPEASAIQECTEISACVTELEDGFKGFEYLRIIQTYIDLLPVDKQPKQPRMRDFLKVYELETTELAVIVAEGSFTIQVPRTVTHVEAAEFHAPEPIHFERQIEQPVQPSDVEEVPIVADPHEYSADTQTQDSYASAFRHSSSDDEL